MCLAAILSCVWVSVMYTKIAPHSYFLSYFSVTIFSQKLITNLVLAFNAKKWNDLTNGSMYGFKSKKKAVSQSAVLY